jgi:hypothetical protein
MVRQRTAVFLAHQNTDDLAVQRKPLQARKVTPVIDRIQPPDETADATRYLGQEHASRGKLVITAPAGRIMVTTA